MTNVLYLCTGNAARSVMATVMTRERAPLLSARGAGTFSIPGLPMSQRTRVALAAMGLADPSHRSRQLGDADALWADVIVGFEPEHVAYVRRTHPEVATVTATLPRLARDLGPPDQPLAARLSALDLAAVELESWEEIVDPAGGDQQVFHRCAAEVRAWLDRLLPRLAPPWGG